MTKTLELFSDFNFSSDNFTTPFGWSCDPKFYNASDGCDCECGIPDPDCLWNETLIYGCELGSECLDGHCVFLNITVPDDWNCSSTFYNASDGCDCECGAPDPDCLHTPEIIYGCMVDQICLDGYCVSSNATVPDTWNCSYTFYNASDGCDCECGAQDPDCDSDPGIIYGCLLGYQCLDGHCAFPNNTVLNSSSWTCPPSFYNSSDGCDCECGAADPDCMSAHEIIYGCSNGFQCLDGHCVELNSTVPIDWICPPSYYNASDGCDCECGVADPDCENSHIIVYGCLPGIQCVNGTCAFPCAT